MTQQTKTKTATTKSKEKPIEERTDIAVRFAGDSGDGMQLAGTQFTHSSAIFGNDISTFPDFPAEIRAPAGSLAGVSGFQVRFGSTEIHTPKRPPMLSAKGLIRIDVKEETLLLSLSLLMSLRGVSSHRDPGCRTLATREFATPQERPPSCDGTNQHTTSPRQIPVKASRYLPGRSCMLVDSY